MHIPYLCDRLSAIDSSALHQMVETFTVNLFS
uniref:Uncharacterized protein n=1 Tax=Anguilla anguilla TaxID=7936 RepID=A0A0E9RK37_ANGAN